MLDLQRPVARLARPFRPTGGHGSVQGSLGLKSGVGAASGGASSAAPTKTSQIFVLVTNFCASFSLVTSRVLVASACPSKGGRGQLRRSPFPSLMRLRDPGVQLEQKGTFTSYFVLDLTLNQRSVRTKSGPRTENSIYRFGNEVRDDRVTFPKL